MLGEICPEAYGGILFSNGKDIVAIMQSRHRTVCKVSYLRHLLMLRQMLFFLNTKEDAAVRLIYLSE